VDQVVTGIVGVLIMATNSAAECAWVLWIKNETTYLRKDKNKPFEVFERWEMENAFNSYADCERVKDRVWSGQAATYDDQNQLPGIVKVQKVPYEAIILSWKPGEDLMGGGFTTLFRCYPDTVDPRGK
jgi:hypothetical protein